MKTAGIKQLDRKLTSAGAPPFEYMFVKWLVRDLIPREEMREVLHDLPDKEWNKLLDHAGIEHED